MLSGPSVFGLSLATRGQGSVALCVSIYAHVKATECSSGCINAWRHIKAFEVCEGYQGMEGYVEPFVHRRHQLIMTLATVDGIFWVPVGCRIGHLFYGISRIYIFM